MNIKTWFKLERLVWIQVIAFLIGSAVILSVIFLLGGIELYKFLFIALVQAFGLGVAVMAILHFFIKLVWKLHTPSLGISFLVFLVGMGIFLSVSISRLYFLQYPFYVQTYGPGSGPGLPLSNMFSFFRHVKDFKVVPDIARDPNDVPPPINVLKPDQKASIALANFGEDEVLELVDEETLPEVGSTVRYLELETTEVISEIAPKIIQNYWTFNDTVPGPMFRIREGDIVEVTIKNNPSSLHTHNVDFHAVSGPGGGGDVSVVAPGESKTFRFKALNPGLFIYHCAVPNMAVHMAHGMYGMILVEPKEGLPEVDKEFYLMQGELYTTGAIGRKGLQAFDAKKMLNGVPTYITFNGRPDGAVGKMHAEVGDVIRLYIGNGGVAHNSSFHVVGEIFDTVYPEASIGGAVLKNVQTTNIPAGGATIVEFKVDYPGTYVLVDHALMRTDKGAWGTIEVSGHADPEIYDGVFSDVSSAHHH